MRVISFYDSLTHTHFMRYDPSDGVAVRIMIKNSI